MRDDNQRAPGGGGNIRRASVHIGNLWQIIKAEGILWLLALQDARASKQQEPWAKKLHDLKLNVVIRIRRTHKCPEMTSDCRFFDNYSPAGVQVCGWGDIILVIGK